MVSLRRARLQARPDDAWPVSVPLHLSALLHLRRQRLYRTYSTGHHRRDDRQRVPAAATAVWPHGCAALGGRARHRAGLPLLLAFPARGHLRRLLGTAG